MAKKLTVNEVSAGSSDLLRGFEDAPNFSAPLDMTEEQDTAGQGTALKATRPSKETPQTPVMAEDKKTIKRPFNLYLPEEDIQYLQDLKRVLGRNPTDIIKTWIAAHRQEKQAQVQEALKRMEDTQNLL